MTSERSTGFLRPDKWIWRKLYWTYRSWRAHIATSPTERLVRHDRDRSYDHLPIRPHTMEAMQIVKALAEQIYGQNWNYYSDALRPENVYVFQEAVSALEVRADLPVNYLEIGSAQGLSMSLVGSLIAKTFDSYRLVSLDPYYADGYREGSRGIYGTERNVGITNETRMHALSLYKAVGIAVDLIQLPSSKGLPLLISQEPRFDVVYIDGLHEGLQPMIDFGQCCALLKPGGIVLIDDHHWLDVAPIKELCDQHALKIAESWKIAAYRLDANTTNSTEPIGPN